MKQKDDLKICVYAICKNEEKFVDRWVNSLINEADYVVVLDTGSTDNTVELLKQYEPFVTVKQFDYFKECGFFRFDKARNDSMKLIPNDADICVVFDFDQVPRKGWSEIIRRTIAEGHEEVHGYIIDHDEFGNEVNRWESRNVHINDPFFIWNRVIHEGIEYYGEKFINMAFMEDFIIDHYPDNKKDRSLYRTLLEYAVKEYPKDPYYAIYLGIELERRYSRKESEKAFMDGLKNCDFTDKLDLKYQMLINLAMVTDDFTLAFDSLKSAESLGVKTRRLYKVYSDIYERLGKTNDAIAMLEKALEIESYSNDWTEDSILYTGFIEDKLSLFYYYQKANPLKSIEYCSRALQLDPNNDRLKTNLQFYYNAYMEIKGE